MVHIEIHWFWCCISFPVVTCLYSLLYICFPCRVMSCSVDSLKFTASWKGRIQEGKLQVKVFYHDVLVEVYKHVLFE